MADFSIAKVVSALPDPLVAERLYLVRVGDGLDIHVTDATAQAKRLNLPTAATLGALVDRRGSPYTVLAEDLGRRVLVDDAVTLPVLGATHALGSIDILSTVAVSITSAATVTPLGVDAIEANAAVSLALLSDDGTDATWLAVGGRA